MKKYLIEADELIESLPMSNLVIVDCRFDLNDPLWGKKDYINSHIPGAVYADLNNDLSSPVTPLSGRHPLPNEDDFTAFLSRIGVDSNKKVIVYDTTSGSFAARLWWLLRSYGHEDVQVLNSGFSAWQKLGYPIEIGEKMNKPTNFNGQFQKNFFVSTSDVESFIHNDEYMIIDARAHNRYAGIEEPLDSIAGHIDGAINVFHQANLTPEGRFLSSEELELLYQFTNGVSNSKNIILYCGSGVTSCVNLLALAQLGKSAARLYAGSWSEWIRDPSHLTNIKSHK